MKEPVYEVFARKKREDPLHHVGCVNAPDDDLARVYAWKTYDEQNWYEMCVVPRAAILPVNLKEGPFAQHEPEPLSEALRAGGPGSYGGSEVAGEEVGE
jgi:1,2-phenylacetyl-CoA epoxidase PaaB subunit